jgi:dienelactone hydrolase
MRRPTIAILLTVISVLSANGQRTFKPSTSELEAAYLRADQLQAKAQNATLNVSLTYGWISGGKGFWYRKDLSNRKREFIKVDTATKKASPLFDHKVLAAALTAASGEDADSERLPFNTVAVTDGLIAFQAYGKSYSFNPETGKLEPTSQLSIPAALETSVEQEPNPEYPAPYAYDSEPTQGRGQREQNVRIREGQVQTRSGDDWTTVTVQGNYSRADADPVTGKIIAFRLLPGDRRLVYLLKSAIANSTRAALEQRLYDQPGDKLDEFEVWTVDPATKTEKRVELAPIMGGGQPWSNPPGVRWRNSRAYFDFPIRGYQEHKLISLDPATGAVRTLVHEKSATFIDQSKTNYWLLEDGKRLIWQSERSGRSHLYMVDTETGASTPITSGEYIVRAADPIEAQGRIIFAASGFGDPSKEDPYHTHLCTIDLDGRSFKRLTLADAHHNLQFSPDWNVFVDSYSRTDAPPVHELRDTRTGEIIAMLGNAEVGQLVKNGIRMPERFVAKGRDGKTDIWGIVIRPSNFNKDKKYPVIENIYAGPHDSFVPKGFRPFFNMHRLAELGFIVVQIDGMGTNNRGKAFHDVAWKNVADAGFPDRILWMKALAKKYPQVDVSRVGVYGTSAGGQSSTGAVLLHGDFYKVAVSSCGCHDNRIDKQWWNEQWMGYPVGAHYDEQSNITNAAKLKGRLMLIVGEQDRNVPPESTFRLADALIKARKEFELVVIPGADHTDGGPYGERKRRDFFVKWLHGVEPPTKNH